MISNFRKMLLSAGILALTAACGSDGKNAARVFVATGQAAEVGSLYEIDTETGDATVVTDLDYPIGAMAQGPDGLIYATTVSERVDPAILLTIDPETGDTTEIGEVIDHDDVEVEFAAITGITFKNGTLYAWEEEEQCAGTDCLLAIDTTSGLAERLPEFGEDFGTCGGGLVNVDGDLVVFFDCGEMTGDLPVDPAAVVNTSGDFDDIGENLVFDEATGDENCLVIMDADIYEGGIIGVVSNCEDYDFVPHLASIDLDTGEVTSLTELPVNIEAVVVVQ